MDGMRIRYLLISFVLSLPVAQAQQRAQYSQYMLNPLVLNPAVSGLEDFIDVKAGYRNQWAGWQGAPKTFYLTAHGALNKADRTSTLPVRDPYGRPYQRSRVFPSQPAAPSHHGVGATLLRDETGPSSRTTLQVSYALHLPITNRIKVATGVGMGFTQHTLDFDLLHVLEPNDPVIQQGKLNTFVPELNAGVLLYDPNFYVGFSASQLFFKKLDYGQTGTANYEWLGRLYNHYFLTAGYRFEVDPDWAILPSVLVKSVRPLPLSFDINAKVAYQDRIWMGLSYRHQDAIVGLLGFNVNYKLNIGYSYDFTQSSVRMVSRGTHEIVVGLMFNNRQRLVCPRIF
ncbi:hypothetical protein BWI97_05200 [Siphonobacter sp. BAB-5405]|nr:hypothetical protein BWI97_05200 [Siphonobacter sp. BAB-5405]